MLVNVPSSRQPSSTCCTWPRLCGSVTMSSDRVGTHCTGRPVRSAHAPTTTYSECSPAFPPNPPPTCGVMTRTFSFSKLSAAQNCPCTRCGIWFDTHNVMRPVSGSTAAAAPSGSIGTTAIRWLTYVPRITCSSPNSTGASSANTWASFDPCCSNSSGAPSRSASSAVVTASSGSMSAQTAWAASTPAANDSASTTAIASPTKRTRSTASGGCLKSACTGAKP